MSKILENKCKEDLKNISESHKSLLLHSCCAPCSSHVITYLAPYFDITILYYNPNIAPKDEYLKRKNEQIKLLSMLESPNKLDFIDCDYDNEKYNELVKGYEMCPEKGERCTICFNLRIEKTAKVAKENDYDYFCTTLSVSPYKNAELINEIGEKMENKYGVKWLHSDFKKENGYKHSIELSHKYGLYRQDYCGCVYSKRDEILRKSKKGNE